MHKVLLIILWRSHMKLRLKLFNWCAFIIYLNLFGKKEIYSFLSTVLSFKTIHMLNKPTEYTPTPSLPRESPGTKIHKPNTEKHSVSLYCKCWYAVTNTQCTKQAHEIHTDTSIALNGKNIWGSNFLERNSMKFRRFLPSQFYDPNTSLS